MAGKERLEGGWRPRIRCLLLAAGTLLWVPVALAVAPVAVNDSYSTGSGAVLNDDLSTNDSGLDGPADTYTLGTAPLNGTLTVNADGTFTYTPDSGYAGTDTFTYQINDGAGGSSSASVSVSVAAATDFLSVANPLLITPEDTAISLGLSVAQDLFDGGALQDIISTDVLFRPDNGGATPLSSPIPLGASGITITGFSSQSIDTPGIDIYDDDYQLLNVRIDLNGRISSGRLANIVDGNLSVLDQYSWANVPLGQSVLSDPSKVVGFSTGASDPVFTVIGNQLQIVETHSLETAYHIEFTTAAGDSTNFLGAKSSVQVEGITQSTLDIAAGVEPTSGKQGLLIVSGHSATGGHFNREHKGFNRIVIDFDTRLISGIIAAVQGETETNTVTYGFEGYPLVDLRNGPATPVDVLSGSATVTGDVTGAPSVTDNPTLYINAAGELVIERTADFATEFTTMYTAEAYERTGFGSIASFVAVDSDDTLFNVSGGVASDGGPINELHFEIPASAQVGLAHMSWNTIGGSDVNENMASGFAVIDMTSNTTSGSIAFIRATTPDLLSWGSVPLNTTMFGATDAGGNPLYQSNKTAGSFTDSYPETARFTLVNRADGSRELIFTANGVGANQTFKQYQGNMQVSWLGSEPFEIEGVPVTGALSHGSPTVNGNWQVDFSDLPELSYIPQGHSSDVVTLNFTLSSSGETETIDVYIEPVVDPVTISTGDAEGFVNTQVPLSISVSSSVDADGSEIEPDPVRLQGVPLSVTLSSSAGTVSNVSSGIWEVSRSALASLEALSPATVSTAVFVFADQVDENDLDGSGSIDDNANSVGADEYDELTFTDTFRLDIFDTPTVVAQVTNQTTPVITGNASLAPGESLMVTVNGVSYTAGDGNLVINPDGTWTLTVPAANTIPAGTYSVTAKTTLGSGASALDVTSSELLIDITPPPAPGVTSQTTQNPTPVISGTRDISTLSEVLTVEVNGVIYTEGDGNLVDNGDGTWDLTIPPGNALADTLYQVVARLADMAGNFSTDPGVDDLVVDTVAPPTPGVTSQVTNDDTPLISGTAIVGAGDTLTVEVNGITYTAGDGNLVDNGNGTWDLTIPPSDVLPEANYDVTATVTDLAGNFSTDPSGGELTIDLTQPATPVVFSQVTSNPTPVISGWAAVGPGETLTVEVNGVTYTAGDGQLTDNGDSTWELVIPPANAVPDNTYNVTATVTDLAGNSNTDGTVSELIVDATAPAVPTVVSQVTNDVTPLISGTATVLAGEILRVDVDGISYTAGDGNLVRHGDGSWDLTIPLANALPDAVYDVTATVTDIAGNVSTDTSSAELTVDTVPPVAPTVDAQLSNLATPVLTGDATVQPGDVLTVTINGVTYTAGDGNLTDNGDGSWSLAIPAANALAEAIYDVQVTVVDLVGNSASDTTNNELEIDLTATGAPTVILTADLNNDALLNVAEASDPQPVDILLPSGAKVGDTLLWTDTASPANKVLTAADIAAGVVTTTVALPADGRVLTVSSLLIDQAGNASPSHNDSATVDISIAGAPTVIIVEDANDDMFLNAAESSGPVDVTVQLPAGVIAGDTLSVTLDGVVSSFVLGAADIAAGTVDVTTPSVASGSTVQADAYITDVAGNTTPTSNDTALVDTTPPFIPSADFLTTNNPTPTLTGNAAVGPGDVLAVSVNGVTYTAADGLLIDDGSGGWSLAIPLGDALADGTYDVLVSLTDPAGNTSVDITVDELIVDTVVPTAPTVVSQITNTQTPTITGTATVGAGEILTVSVDGVVYAAGDGNLVDNGDGTWVLIIPASNALAEATYDVTATVSDPAGNVSTDVSSGELSVDITPTVAPTVVLTADVNNDAFLNAAEAQDPQPVDILLPAGAAVGDTLLWTDTVSPANTVLSAADIAAGVVQTSVALPTDGSGLTVSAMLVDLAGNVSPSGSDSATVDVTPSDPPQPVIVADADNNALLNLSEASNPQPIEILLPASAAEGFTLTMTDGTTVFTAILTAADIAAGVVSTTLALPSDGSVFNVTANLKDLAGNVSTNGADLALVDFSAPDQPVIVINEDANNDGFINIAENVGPVDVDVLLPASASAGDILTTSLRGVVTTQTLTAADIAAGSINLTTTAPSQGALVIAEATLTDPAGNDSATTDDIAQMDVSAPLVPTADSQITNSGTPVLTGTAAVGPGDTLSVVVNGVSYVAGDGNLVDIGDGTWSLSIPAADALTDGTYDVVVEIEDPAGNTSSDTTSNELFVDLTATAAPTIVLTADANNDALLNATEALNPQPIEITLPAGAVVGDTLLWTDGVTPANKVLSAADIAAGAVSSAVGLPADGSVLSVSTVLTDQAGNTSPADNDSATVDTTASVAPAVNFLETNNATPTLTGNATLGPGDLLRVTVNGVTYIAGGGALVDNGDGTWTLSIPTINALPDGTYAVTATVTDAAGNVSTDVTGGELRVDLNPTVAPTVVLTADVNNDALLNSVEAVDPQPVDILLPAGAVVGDTLLWTDGSNPANTVLSAADIAAGVVSTTVPLPADGSVLTVSSVLTDRAGNASPSGSDSAAVDTQSPTVPVIIIVEDVDDDGFVNLAESVGAVDVNVLLPADAVAGDTLTVALDGVATQIVLSAADIAAGVVSVNTPAPADNLTVVAEAFITDIAGNTTATVDDSALMDLSAPLIPTANNLIINNAAPSLTGHATVGPGDVLSVSVNGVTYTDGDGNLTYNGSGGWALVIPASDALADGTYDVSVSLTDPAGNTSVDVTLDELIVDTVAPQAPGVTSQITSDSTPVISGTAPVSPGLTLTVEVNGVAYTQGDGNLVVNPDGTWDLTIPASDALADGRYQVVAVVTDLAGNSAVDSGIDELVVDSVAPATPGVTSQVTNTTVPVISGTATVAVGETLSVTVNGITYTAGDGNLVDNSDGTWDLAIPVADALPEAIYSVTATVSDTAANLSVDPSSNELTIDLTAPDLPTVTPQLSNTGTPVFAGTAVLLSGETLSVSVNGVTYTAGDGNLVDNGDGTWTLAIPPGNALPEGTFDVAVTVLDVAGNSTSDVSVDELKIDLSATVAPTPVLTADLNNDALLSAAEAQAVQPVTILLPPGAAAGDSLLWSDGVAPASTVLSAADIAAGAVQTFVALPANGAVLNVTAVLVDTAGNASPSGADSATVDLVSPDVPAIVIAEDANDDGFLNISESQGLVDVVINLPTTASVGDVLFVTLDGVNTSTVLTAVDIALGSISTTTALILGSVINADAQLVDPAGNASPVVDDSALVDNVLPLTPLVTPLVTNDVTPEITGTAVLAPGDELSVTINGATFTPGDGNLVVNPDDTWTLSIPVGDDLPEGVYEIVAAVTDPAGNISADTTVDELIIDLTLPPVPDFMDTLSASNTPTIGGQVQLSAGDAFTVTVNGVTYTEGDGFLTVDANGNWDLMIDPSQPLVDGVYDVMLSVSDAAGNTVSNQMGQQLTIDTGAPGLAVDALDTVLTYRPVLSGTSDADDGSTVTIRDADGNVVCEAIVMNGLWRCKPSVDLAEGVNDLSAEVADAAGNLIVVDFSVTVSADFDGDGIANSVEGFGDTDGDGVADSVDLDADNDGIPDTNESTLDSDGDGLPNYLDGDADNDGIADILEVDGFDEDRDFTVDNFMDLDNNGLSDDLQVFPLVIVDTDFDGVPDYLDVDSDNDGVPDLQEILGVDVDNNGRIDDFVDLDGDGVDDGVQALPLLILDSDIDGAPNHLDLNSDNDALSDLLESLGLDVNEDGIVDPMTDVDRDSIPDSVDFSIVGGLDADGDDIEDSADVDFALGDDTDGDGIIDEFDPDANGDGFFDASFADAVLPDTDANGVPDLQEAFGVLRTGRRGAGGCAVSPTGEPNRDPMLLMLVLLALARFAQSVRFSAVACAVRSASRGSTVRLPNLLCLLLVAVFMTNPGTARADDEGGFHQRFFIGFGLGASYLDPDESEIPFKLEERTDAAFAGYLGYDLFPRVSIELGFNDLGRAGLQRDHHVTYQQGTISALFYALNGKQARERRTGLSAFARLGVSKMNNESDIGYVRDNDISIAVGAGVELGHASGLAVRGEITSFDIDSNYLGVSLLYRFGHPAHRDNYVEKPAEVAPVPVVEEHTPLAGPETDWVAEYVVFFKPDKVLLDANADRVIDGLVSSLRTNPNSRIDVAGYADLQGPVLHNQRLSEQRAQNVVNRLLSRGIDQSRIEFKAGGETDRFGSMSRAQGRQENRRAHINVFNAELSADRRGSSR